MNIKEQLLKLKENWLLVILLILAVLLVTNFDSAQTFSLSRNSYGNSYSGYAESADQALGMAKSAMYYPAPAQDFAPEVQSRKITKSYSLTSEVERNTFKDAELQLKSIVQASSSLIISENSNRYGEDLPYYQGNYQIKVKSEKAQSVMEQLKKIGEITYFSENAQDITGSYLSTQEQLELEKERLLRYKELYSEVKDLNEKIQLSDRIFEQERTIKYLEESLNNQDLQVDYSTIYFSLQEKQSEYANIALAKLSQLVQTLVNSLNSLLNLLFLALPYAVLALLVWLVIRFGKSKKKKN
jgi:hypothetical protein